MALMGSLYSSKQAVTQNLVLMCGSIQEEDVSKLLWLLAARPSFQAVRMMASLSFLLAFSRRLCVSNDML